MQIVVATGNQGKLSEFRALLADWSWQLCSSKELGLIDPAETGLSFVENALIKARHAAEQTGLPAIADDSGLCVDALEGAPGLYSARFSGAHGDDAANNAALLMAMQNVAQRQACFVSVIVMLRHAKDPLPLIAQGIWQGEILHEARGDAGFGYDPLFLDPAHQLSAAEMPASLKHQLSHRAKALAQLRGQLSATLWR